MEFLRITYSQAVALANDPNELYTPFYNGFDGQFYIYSPPYTPAELPNTFTIPQQQFDGLTPTNPTKPMFPKR